MDYGCGKLRYAHLLAEKCDLLTLVDSPAQLDRTIRSNREKISIRDIATNSLAHCNVTPVRDFQSNPPQNVDLVFCANVLSAIPSKAERTKALNAIRNAICGCGRIVVINQHTNSFYSEVCRRSDTVPHLDGYIVPGKNGASYYGILTKDKTTALLRDAGFHILEHWIAGQSNIAIARAEA